MDFSLPQDLVQFLDHLDSFIEREILPLQHNDDNNRFFDHRREYARTDFEAGGLPRPEWEALLDEARKRADEAGFYRLPLPKEYGGKQAGNLWMAVIREHLASKGLGLFNDLQNEHSVVGNFPDIVMLIGFGSEAQKKEFIWGRLEGRTSTTFGLTEPHHGSDATHMDTKAIRELRDGVRGWRIDGAKMWQTNMHRATHCIIFARTSGKAGDARGITAFIIPSNHPGIKVLSYEWTFNMPTDHATVSFNNVFVPESAVLGEADNGLAIAQAFVHENRIRQAASSLGAAVFCIQESIKYARQRKPFGEELAKNQAIQFPLVELATQAEMLRLLIRKTAWEMDKMSPRDIDKLISDKVSMCNYWANRLCTQAADRAIQVHGGIGYSRHKPFEHIYRHHRRYRITEGSEEIQMRKVAAFLFGYIGPKKDAFAKL
ncbi:acyl-CoA dehydrogenase-like protein [Dendrothele bispora CBS 962.96]|uniref:Acyl-CoA dehydrogenase-like protein n=1 Tax=Dendrothele bispora (strain CBS 962.96) TaxID=1314807 RepID=A0A4S8MI85_DENBC|nr:acyl-CoA dehydrogenase-like protein [Dendrothele bispora CBS 962.96]